jgi:ABC-type antimicrobial peptide transport system ATPase subunit
VPWSNLGKIKKPAPMLSHNKLQEQHNQVMKCYPEYVTHADYECQGQTITFADSKTAAHVNI